MNAGRTTQQRREPAETPDAVMVPGPAGWPVSVAETHIGIVFLVGTRAYKMKKPVRNGFLDFRGREARLRACRREIELNRRLSPDVYLGISDVNDVDGNLCEHLVVMRRMPAERRLSTLVRQGVPLESTIVDLAHQMAAFHRTANRSERISAAGTRAALAGRWEDSFEQVQPYRSSFGAGVLEEIERRTREFLAGRGPLFASRIQAGRIVDGHGDLLADDIFCLDDGPRILDCLEFDDELRYIDGLDDIAFLAMDLERLGAPDLADLLVSSYSGASGDPAPRAVVEHYLAYRAFVRAKVAVLRAAQGDPDALRRAGRDAALTVDHLRRGEVRLVLVGGLPGTGKTTVATAVAERLGATVLSTDRIRVEMFGPSTPGPAAPGYGVGRYRPEQVDRVYSEMLRRAAESLGMGRTVVLDASWTTAAHRTEAVALARTAISRAIAVECVLPTDVAASRLRARHGSLSEADPGVAEKMAASHNPWPEAFKIETIKSQDVVVSQIVDLVTAAEE